ncbi:hypothetical protein JD77_05314 [Micromonospora olivasterospora]|uniref:Uncharacterized protein n=1 Tax=Micromonospora olivasterospora TaxID=1880 RepID=A0A562IGY2_MICOL|nr:hypothetical protein JD77_05314 [Micromonospora olivasterospora]
MVGGRAVEVVGGEAVGGQERLGEGGRVAAVGEAPLESLAFDEPVAAAVRGGGCVDPCQWERFHTVWPILPHPFSGFPANMTGTGSMLRAIAWYCASLVM